MKVAFSSQLSAVSSGRIDTARGILARVRFGRNRAEVMRQVIIYTDENGEWCASCPSLPGCYSQGDTHEETTKNIREAIQLYVEALEADGLLRVVTKGWENGH